MAATTLHSALPLVAAALLAILAEAAAIPTTVHTGHVSLTPEAAKDQIHDLPGIPEGVTFRQFSGYIDVGKGRKLFYWFVESQGSPAEDPLVLWTNGGPGCSGLTGFLSEQGPFRANAKGTLDRNPYAWNKLANMIFIEQPAGVGFSTADMDIEYGDDQASQDNAAFIKGFLARFPEYKSSDFYLTSESYGGHYLPTLAKRLVDEGMPTFKGLAVGNPLTWMPYRDWGQYATYAAHNMVPKPLWDEFVKAGCILRPSANASACEPLADEMDTLTQEMDPYALDFPVCRDAARAPGRDERRALMRKVRQTRDAARGAAGKLGGYFPDYKPCTDNYMTAYLNKAEVQAAIHVAGPGSVQWGVCSDAINEGYNQDDVAAPMMPIWKELVKHPELNLLVYSGDDDSICATSGAQLWIWGMGAPHDKWRPWHSGGQVAGFTVGFPGMRFATVHGAGHMVPSTRPQQALDLFRRFLSKSWK